MSFLSLPSEHVHCLLGSHSALNLLLIECVFDIQSVLLVNLLLFGLVQNNPSHVFDVLKALMLETDECLHNVTALEPDHEQPFLQPTSEVHFH